MLDEGGPIVTGQIPGVAAPVALVGVSEKLSVKVRYAAPAPSCRPCNQTNDAIFNFLNGSLSVNESSGGHASMPPQVTSRLPRASPPPLSPAAALGHRPTGPRRLQACRPTHEVCAVLVGSDVTSSLALGSYNMHFFTSMLEACLPVAPPYLRILHGLSFFPKVIAVWMFSLKLVAKPVFLLPFSFSRVSFIVQPYSCSRPQREKHNKCHNPEHVRAHHDAGL